MRTMRLGSETIASHLEGSSTLCIFSANLTFLSYGQHSRLDANRFLLREWSSSIVAITASFEKRGTNF